jgi:alpha/beta superfamily hydrolase
MTTAFHTPPVPPEEVSFETAYGITLEGILHRPRPREGLERPAAGVVLCHPHPGLGGTMRTPLVARLALGLAASGRAVLRFNFRGVGRSGGAQTGGELEPLDVAAAVTYLRRQLELDHPALAGWSFGSLMALAHARTDPGLSALAVIAPPLAALDPPDGIESIAAPSLWVVGDRDPYCAPDAIDPMPGEHQVIAGANHFFWAKEDALVETVVSFLDRTQGTRNP